MKIKGAKPIDGQENAINKPLNNDKKRFFISFTNIMIFL